jgi:hypothetical protein
MKIAVRLILIAVLLLGIFKWEMVETYALKAKEEARKYVLQWVQTPEEKQATEPLPPVPPPNVYYTLRRIEYPDPPRGFKSFEAGMPVRKVGEGGGKYVIEAGADRALVDPVFLTREPAEIAQALKLAQKKAPPSKGHEDARIRGEIARLDEKISALKAEKIKVEGEEAAAKKLRRGYFGTSALFIQNEIDRYTAEKRALESSQGRSTPPLVQSAPPPTEPLQSPPSAGSLRLPNTPPSNP